MPNIRTCITLLFLAGVFPAEAAIYYTNPPFVTAGAPTLDLDIQRIPAPGETAGFGNDELNSFEWFAPNVWIVDGQSVKLPPATLVQGDTVRVRLDASLLRTPGIANIVYTRGTGDSRQREVIALFLNRPPQIEGVLAPVQANTRMSQTIEAVNGTGPYRWSIASGSLPAGVALVDRAQSADFMGTPTTPGNYGFTLRVTDRFGIGAEKALTIAVTAPPIPLSIATTSLPSGVVGVAYQATLQATGGSTPYVWSSVGSLPAGLSLSAAGALTGTPTAAGSYNLVVRVTGGGSSEQKTLALVISGAFASFEAASFEPGVAAPESIVAGYGENLALSSVSVAVRDGSGKESPAPLLFAGARQVNYVVPGGIATGAATVTVRSGSAIVAVGSLMIQSVAPGIFTANADGKGVAAAGFLRITPGQPQATGAVFRCDPAPGGCVPAAVDLAGASDSVYLVLFGTGIRGRSSLAGVTATVGGTAVPVAFADRQGEFSGLDQINLGPLPRSLAGRGEVAVQVNVDGKAANRVTIAIQ